MALQNDLTRGRVQGRRGGVLVHVTGSDHPAADHEASHNREGKKD